MARRQYKNPPIQEALCEFRFVPGQEWDVTVVGKLHDRVKEQYDGKTTQQDLVTANFTMPEAGGLPSFALNRNYGRTQFPSSDGQRLLAVGPDLLSVHGFAPYEGWDALKPRIADALGHYVEVANPTAVGRIGIRYVNRVIVPGDSIELATYFLCSPDEVTGLPERMSSFVQRTEYDYGDQVRLLLTFASAPSVNDHEATFLLDVDVIWEASANVGLDDAMGLVEDLRCRERDAFEALITPELREIFDAP